MGTGRDDSKFESGVEVVMDDLREHRARPRARGSRRLHFPSLTALGVSGASWTPSSLVSRITFRTAHLCWTRFKS